MTPSSEKIYFPLWGRRWDEIIGDHLTDHIPYYPEGQ
jgi:hypothetical protein